MDVKDNDLRCEPTCQWDGKDGLEDEERSEAKGMSSTCLSLFWVGLGRVGSVGVRVGVGVVVASLLFPWLAIGVFHPHHERSAAHHLTLRAKGIPKINITTRRAAPDAKPVARWRAAATEGRTFGRCRVIGMIGLVGSVRGWGWISSLELPRGQRRSPGQPA